MEGDAAAVIRIARPDKEIPRTEFYFGIANPGRERPGGGELPLGLRILAEAGNGIIFVTAKIASHTQGRAGEILIALASFLRSLIVDSRRNRQRPGAAATVHPS